MLTDKEQVKIRSKLMSVTTSELVRILDNNYDDSAELMQGIRGDGDLYADKWLDIVELAANELNMRVPSR